MNQKSKIIILLISLAVTVLLLSLLIMNVFANMQSLEIIRSFETVNLSYHKIVDVGTDAKEIDFPKSVRAITEVLKMSEESSFVQAKPSDDTEFDGYKYLEPSNAAEQYITNETVIYTVVQSDNNQEWGYRVYGSLDGSENQWWVCTESGEINGAVKEVSLDWYSEDYRSDKTGRYTFTAQPNGFTVEGTQPTAIVDVQLSFEERTIFSNGISVSGNLPTNAVLKVSKENFNKTEFSEMLTDIMPENAILDKGIVYDITIMVGDEEWQPSEDVRVTVSNNNLKNVNSDDMMIAHIKDETNETIEKVEVEVKRDAVEFATDGFSKYVFFTVDFHYDDLMYSLEGEGSVKLSEIFENLNIQKKTENITDITFSSPELLLVTKSGDNDYLLTSLKSFDTDETLTVKFSSGSDLVLKVTDPAYIGNIPVRKLDHDLADFFRKPTGVQQIGSYRVAGRIAEGAQTFLVKSIKAGETLAHCKFINAAAVNGKYYDVEVIVTMRINHKDTFYYGLNFFYYSPASRYTIRSYFANNHSVPIPQNAQMATVQLKFYETGTNKQVTFPALAYGNTCWTSKVNGEIESFAFADNGYYLYSTTPQVFTYSTSRKVWHAKQGTNRGTTPACMYTFSNYSNNITIAQYANYDSVSGKSTSTTGMEFILGIPYAPVRSDVTLQKEVVDASDTVDDTNFEFQVQTSNESGAVISDSTAVGTPTKSQSVARNTTATISGLATSTYQTPGTYYRVIEETKGGNDAQWTNDTSKWVQRNIVTLNKETAKLSINTSYKKLGANDAWSTTVRPKFINTYYGGAVSVGVSLRKQVIDSSNTVSDTNFTFRVQSSDANGNVNNDHSVSTPTKTQSVARNSTATIDGFGTTTYAAPGTYYRLITETAGSEPNWEYDSSKWLQIIVVAKNVATGKLEATVTYKKLSNGTVSTETPLFVNRYYGPVSVNVTLRKQVVDNSNTVGDTNFTFRVQSSDANGNVNNDHSVSTPTKTQSVARNSTATIDGLGTTTYTNEGTYYNVITEVAGSDTSWEYDSSRWLQIIVVAKNTTTGRLEATVTYRNLSNGTAGTATPLFVNTYYVPVTVPVDVRKQVVNRSETNGSMNFSFRVQASNANGDVTNSFTITNPTKTQSFTGNTTGTVSDFGLSTHKTAGTYYKLITESTGDDKNWVYDTTKWLQIVTVTKNVSQGRMSVSIKYKNLATGVERTDNPLFVNKEKTALIKVQKKVNNFTSYMQNQLYPIILSGDVDTMVTLRHNEISKPIYHKVNGNSDTVHVSEIVPMSFIQNYKVTIVNNSGGSAATITGKTVTVHPGDDVTIVVENRYESFGYFVGRGFAENIFRQS